MMDGMVEGTGIGQGEVEGETLGTTEVAVTMGEEVEEAVEKM